MVAAALLTLVMSAAASEEVYLPPERFVADAFAGTPPPAQVLWLTGALRSDVEHILGHPPQALRARYWRRDARTVWVLEEIGKEEPITAGFVVDDDALREVRVLVYRESRGWEVRHDFFTRQFAGARLTTDQQLDARVDNISGATLSASALQRLARLALRLHRHVAANASA